MSGSHTFPDVHVHYGNALKVLCGMSDGPGEERFSVLGQASGFFQALLPSQRRLSGPPAETQEHLIKGLDHSSKIYSEGWRHRLLEVPSRDRKASGLGPRWGLSSTTLPSPQELPESSPPSLECL